jgi:F-type H+-transporting ATPase subunit b
MLDGLIILAQEETESGSGLSLILPDPYELVAGVLAFLIVFFFVWKRAWPSINRMLENRRQAVAAELTAAETAKKEAESLRADYERQLAEAKGRGNEIIEEARKTADQMKSEMVARAQAEADQLVVKAREEAAGEKARALAEAKQEVAGISVDLAEKVVGANLDEAAQKRLVDQFMADLEKM